MKYFLKLLTVMLIVLCLMAACSGKPSKKMSTQIRETAEQETTAPVRKVLTEQEVRDLFYQYEVGTKGKTVIDCIAVSDSACGVVGVVQYTDTDQDGVMFAFLTVDGSLGGRCGTPNCTAVKGTLEYLGNDTIAYQFQTAEGENITNTISYSNDGNGCTNFKITSK